MEKSMNISYEIGDKLYLNITNKCPCNCTFCIRNNGDGAYGSDPLWLEHQPSFDEVKANLENRNLDSYKEIIFCGYGEPTNELELLCKTADFIKQTSKTPIRLNSNGLGKLINGRDIANDLKGRVDTVSVSLNAPTAEEYMQVTRPCYKNEDCFGEMIKFAQECAKYVPNVMFTVVDVIGEEEIKRSQEVADKAGIALRVREYISF